MTSLLVLLTAKLESIKETNHEEDKALDLGLEGEAPSVTARFLRMYVCDCCTCTLCVATS